MTDLYMPGADPAYQRAGQAFRDAAGVLHMPQTSVEARLAMGAVQAPAYDPATHTLVRTDDPSAPWAVEERPAAPVPGAVTARQARLALFDQGLLDDLTAMLGDPAYRREQIEWESATQIERASALVEAIGGALGLTSDQIDALFRSAATL